MPRAKLWKIIACASMRHLAVCGFALVSASAAAQTISIGSATGTAPGPTAPETLAVTFTQSADFPVAGFSIRIEFPNAFLSATVTDANGGRCAVDNAQGRIVVLSPQALGGIPSNDYCLVSFSILPGTPEGPVLLDTRIRVPGDCVDGNAVPVECTLVDGSIDVVGAVAPTLIYEPATELTFVGAPGSQVNAAIAVTPSGGSGSGPAATARLGNCQIQPVINPAVFACQSGPDTQLDFTPGVDAGDIRCSCQIPASGLISATLSCDQSIPLSAGMPTARSWNLNCAANPGAIALADGSTLSRFLLSVMLIVIGIVAINVRAHR